MVSGDIYLFEIYVFAVPNTCRVKRRGTINQFQPEGQPQKFLLQLVRDLLTINFDLIFIII